MESISLIIENAQQTLFPEQFIGFLSHPRLPLKRDTYGKLPSIYVGRYLILSFSSTFPPLSFTDSINFSLCFCSYHDYVQARGKCGCVWL